MRITIKCFATLSKYLPENAEAYELEDGSPVSDVVSALGVPAEELRLIFINGRAAGLETVLAEGDRLGLFPPVGGG